MSATIFECYSPAGELLARGPVQGSGGKLGFSCAHLPQEERDAESLRTVELVQRVYGRKGRQNRLYEPRAGCVAVYPGYCAAEDGEPVAVPLEGTRFVVAEEMLGGR